MKVLIQNPLTLSYFENDHKWTANPEGAMDFKNTRNAAYFCSEHDLLDMEIVLKFPQDRYDVHMPAWTAVPERARRETPQEHFAA